MDIVTTNLSCIDARAAASAVVCPDDLQMGPPDGPRGRLTVDRWSFYRDGQPWLPVMGEFHFSRYPRAKWDEALCRMRTGGVDIVATYLFWLHHEPLPGEVDWSDNRDLRAFLTACGRAGLLVWLRMGPFANGECLHGGLPEWVLHRCQARTNDPAWMELTRRWYGLVAEQVRGRLWVDGGALIGAQVENEFEMGWGTGAGTEHLLRLRSIAEEAGIRVPYWSITGWGSPVPDAGLLPVQGGLPDNPWDPGYEPPPPRDLYRFSNLLAAQGGGAQAAHGYINATPGLTPTPAGLWISSYDARRFPLIMGEHGTGFPTNWRRRYLVSAADGFASTLVKVGQGANVLGYYMYHGGSHPLGRNSQNTHCTEYPAVGYDFHAPLGEFGAPSPVYHSLRLLHGFLKHWGGWLAPLHPSLPEGQAAAADDTGPLRWAVRAGADCAAVFLNNHQRRVALPTRNGLRLRVELVEKTVELPAAPFTLQSGVAALWPIGLREAGLNLRYVVGTPFARLNRADGIHLAIAATPGVEAEIAVEREGLAGIEVGRATVEDADGFVILRPQSRQPLCLRSTTGMTLHLLVLPEHAALRTLPVRLGVGEHLVQSDDDLWPDADGCLITGGSAAEAWLDIYPPPSLPIKTDGGELQGTPDGAWWRSRSPLPRTTAVSVESAEIFRPAADTGYPYPGDTTGLLVRRLQLPADLLASYEEAELAIQWTGDTARLYCDGQLVGDRFWDGSDWRLRIGRWRSRLLAGAVLVLVISPWPRENPVYVEDRPSFDGTRCARLDAVTLRPEFSCRVWAMGHEPVPSGQAPASHPMHERQFNSNQCKQDSDV